MGAFAVDLLGGVEDGETCSLPSRINPMVSVSRMCLVIDGVVVELGRDASLSFCP